MSLGELALKIGTLNCCKLSKENLAPELSKQRQKLGRKTKSQGAAEEDGVHLKHCISTTIWNKNTSLIFRQRAQCCPLVPIMARL